MKTISKQTNRVFNETWLIVQYIKCLYSLYAYGAFMGKLFVLYVNETFTLLTIFSHNIFFWCLASYLFQTLLVTHRTHSCDAINKTTIISLFKNPAFFLGDITV